MAYFTEQELQQIATNNGIPLYAVRVENPITQDVFWVNPNSQTSIARIRSGEINSTNTSLLGASSGVFLATNKPFIIPSFTPSQNPSQVITAPPVVNLADVLVLTPSVIARDYKHGSGRAIDSQDVFVKNTSNLADISVTIRSAPGVTFSPNVLEIPKLSQLKTTVSFDYTVIETYPDGTSNIGVIFDVTAPNAIIAQPQPQQQQTTPNGPSLPFDMANPTAPPDIAVPDVFPETDFEIRTLIDPIVEWDGYIAYSVQQVRVDWVHQDSSGVRVVLKSRVESGDRTIIQDNTPVPQRSWVNGLDGALNGGDPPIGWVIDPYGGAWYPPNDPFVLSNFGRTPPSTGQSTSTAPVRGTTIITDFVPTDIPSPTIPPAPSSPPPINPSIPSTPNGGGTGTGGTDETTTFTNGQTGTSTQGSVPFGWVQDPFTGGWYPPDDPYVTSGWGGRITNGGGGNTGGGRLMGDITDSTTFI
jgi:hypothetical protein